MLNELVERLSKGKHKVVIGHRDEPPEELTQRINDGFIHIKFTETKGGTDIGINVDSSKNNVSEVEFNKKGKLHLEGITTLNYNKVRCIADIDAKTKKGLGYLVAELKEKETKK